MDGESLVDKWTKHGNNKVAEAAIKFEKNYLQHQPDEFFCVEY